MKYRPSYILYYYVFISIDIGPPLHQKMKGIERREAMEDLVSRVSIVLKEVAAELGLLQAEDKE